MKKMLLILITVFMSLCSLSAETIKGEVVPKDDLLLGAFSIDGTRGNTYAVELWCAQSGTDDYILCEGISADFGQGLAYNTYREFSFTPSDLPAGVSGELVFKYKLIPEQADIWSAGSVVVIEEPQGMTGDWFNENLANNRYFTFGIVGVSENGGKMALDFVLTNTHVGTIDLVWDRDRAAMVRINKTNGAEQVVYSGNLYFNGQSRGQYGHYTVNPNESVNGQIVLPMGLHLAEGISMGTFEIRLPNRNVTENMRFGSIE